ncbi:ribonucleases P/MRP protein subunit POP1-domain-containing protein [Amylocarpus encephaloides]|uniref:Ribonucleases P/MRP protein subunit POP1-domain-containing protein n=1 Tax=Amylocarpus encephaloides TaxID=45428 RepID=A0A9P8CB74_9HELO|nr:ribonucleases P/MRP protein subunit POP1-domain-containing protein [Amylocarpus encephaloides]
MPPKKATQDSLALVQGQKRKAPPQYSFNGQNHSNRGRDPKRVKLFDARTILAQNSEAALKNGELDLSAFLRAREFEIKALEDGLQKSKTLLTKRAFQQVPRDLRRRTASHNVKRVPKRLQKRAAKEMKDDNTPTVNRKNRRPGTTRGRLRAETAKRLGLLAVKKKAKPKDWKGVEGCVETRAPRPKIRRNQFNSPPKPISKFRKRQIHKTWLPTHMWHAKRARMTEPKNPLWRFAIPITSTEKSYRPTHRAAGARGAVAWDMSYMSTIALEGPVESLKKLLNAVGVNDASLWGHKGDKWRDGKRSWSGWISRDIQTGRVQIGPAVVVWCTSESESTTLPLKRPLRKIFVRIHPSIFLETWEEILRLAKLQRPTVQVEDLRFEIGSISITGPGSTETLLGILHPYHESGDLLEEHGRTFRSLAGVSNPGSLPANAVLAFSIMDPRLRYPSRNITLPRQDDEEATFALLEMLASWPLDDSPPSRALFDRDARFKATKFPTQKSINRRKGQALPGAYPTTLSTDPPIPLMLLTSRTASPASAQGMWTLLAPWKCILPIWYGLVHYPLTSGGNPRFGGLDELRQTHFENGTAFFPVDYPGTAAGFTWEVEQRTQRKAKWERRPKGKRVEWESFDLGASRKGELGRGWSCDFERLIGAKALPDVDGASTQGTTQNTDPTPPKPTASIELKTPVQHVICKEFTSLFSTKTASLPPASSISVVKLTLVKRGIASPCARIYRLPATVTSSTHDSIDTAATASTSTSKPPSTTRLAWLSLLPTPTYQKPLPNIKSLSKQKFQHLPLNVPLPQRKRLLAQSLLQDPPLQYPATNKQGDDHPLVPDEEDLIGFVTTGEYNLAEGKGVAIGSVSVCKVLEGERRAGKGEGASRLCIVRDAGEKIGRLARWEAI